jgi:hypothetical protein
MNPLLSICDRWKYGEKLSLDQTRDELKRVCPGYTLEKLAADAELPYRSEGVFDQSFRLRPSESESYITLRGVFYSCPSSNGVMVLSADGDSKLIVTLEGGESRTPFEVNLSKNHKKINTVNTGLLLALQDISPGDNQ